MNKMKYKAALLVMLVAALAATVVFGAVRGTPRGRGPELWPWLRWSVGAERSRWPGARYDASGSTARA